MIKFPVDGPTMKLKELKEEVTHFSLISLSFLSRFSLISLSNISHSSHLSQPPLAPGKKRKIAASREVFFETWKTCKGDGAFWRNGKSSGVFFWRMLPWWVFSHALQLPRKYCQFLPPLIIEHLLRFLDNPVSNPHLILIVLMILT